MAFAWRPPSLGPALDVRLPVRRICVCWPGC